MLKTSLIIFVLFTISHISKGEDGNCDLLSTLFYEGAGCDPVTPEGSPCPTQYNCSFVKLSPDYCLLRGGKKEIGYYHDPGLDGCACKIICTAPGTERNAQKFADWTCGGLLCSECSEHFHRTELAENCHRTYKLGQDCSSGHICETDENRDSLAKCEVNGITYKEGQQFRLDRSCANCICKKGFSGTASPEFCLQDKCSLTYGDYENLQNNCARIYPNDKTFAVTDFQCCNREWLCPKDIDEVEQFNNTTSTDNNSDLKCVFGERKFEIGQSFVVNAKNVECKCELPPLMSCRPL